MRPPDRSLNLGLSGQPGPVTLCAQPMNRHDFVGFGVSRHSAGWRSAFCRVLALGVALVHGLARAAADPTSASPPPASTNATEARQFWSFQPVRRPALPQSPPGGALTHNPIDAFVLARLEEKGLGPSPPASKGELIRRLCFDLIGLPPAPEDIRAFLDDASAGAYERLVDRLLNRPEFGERWAQHWLDVVRYAETEGFEYDRHLPEAWRYRDYVIQAFNEDKPFDRFLTEQLAGDELTPETQEQLTAAIFHRLGPVRRNAGNPEIALSRNEVLTERTDVIGAAFLGLTVGCARCHDHKFDPISQKDYYRLQAYFAASQENDILLVSADEKKDWEAKSKAAQGELRRLRQAADRAEGEERTRLNNQIEALESKMPSYPATIPSIHNDADQRTAIHVLHRGQWEKKGEPVAMRPPSVLVDESLPELPMDLARPRTELARWLTDPRHPLTARVIVNRLWQHHFGVGLVKTPNDFGHNGDRPSHPELLDWLAAELVRNGWHLKPLHRLMVCSAIYQQSSQPAGAAVMAAAGRIDPENRLLWRFQQRRLSAEEIRDTMLAVCGRLNPRRGGPSVMVPVDSELVQLLYKPAQWEVSRNPGDYDRRSIYLIAKRNLRLPFMETFDQPPLLTSCGRREASTHAPQALEMLNGQLSNALATAFAQRLERESGGDLGALIERAYALALGRSPTSAEHRLAATFLQEQPLREFALALFNLNAFLYVQ